MSDLTEVELLWLEKRIENRIRFGACVEEQNLDRRRRLLSFAPGSIFAFVRWTSNDFGTVISRIDILRAVAPGQRCSTVPYVTARRRDFPAAIGLAEGRTGAPADRCRRSTRHQSGRRRARLLASRSQPPVRQRKAAAVHAARHQAGFTGGGSAMKAAKKTLPDVWRWLLPSSRRSLRRRLRSTFGTHPRACQSGSIGCSRRQACVTELVAVQPPEPLATFLDLNGYLPVGVPMLKRVLALPGQTVCRKGLTISVDDDRNGRGADRDGRGRPLPNGRAAASSQTANSFS